jgi:hypothetical protein
MTLRLQKYLELERLMLILEEAGDEDADKIRDLLDPIWYSLSDHERKSLDDRTIGRMYSIEGISLPVGEELFAFRPTVEGKRLPEGSITDWNDAA